MLERMLVHDEKKRITFQELIDEYFPKSNNLVFEKNCAVH